MGRRLERAETALGWCRGILAAWLGAGGACVGYVVVEVLCGA
jgi:hypothetical protein